MVTAGFIACQDSMQSPYEDFIKDGEIVYPSKVDSITIYSGKNRMMVEFLKPDDPTISKARIYWKNKQDSIEVDIGQEQDTVRVIVDSLEQEGTYAVNVHLYDNDGNVSVGESAVGRVYGGSYASTLRSRPTRSVGLDVSGEGSIVIDWVKASEDEIGTNISYTDSTDTGQTIFVPVDSSISRVFDLKNLDMSNLEYQTMFKPEPNAIDTFYADIRSAELEKILLRNAEYPIQDSVNTGKFGIPAKWIVNDAAKNQPEGMGGWKKNNTLGLTTWPGNSSHVENGKIYKTVNLPAGSYSLEVDFRSFDSFEHYIVVAKGDSLPNTASLDGESLTYADFSDKKLDFDLTEKTKISFGFLVNMLSDGKTWWVNNVYLNYNQ